MKRKTKWVPHDGTLKTIAQLAKQYSLSKQVVEYRLKKGIELSAPKQHSKYRIPTKGIACGI